MYSILGKLGCADLLNMIILFPIIKGDIMHRTKCYDRSQVYINVEASLLT